MIALATPLSATPAPWEWPLDERIRLRTELIAAALARRPEYRIEGRKHPEAFFPCEAYENFVRRAYELSPALSQRQRARMSKPAVALGLPEDFWTIAHDAAAKLIAAHREERRLASRLAAANDTTRVAILAQIDAMQHVTAAARRDGLAATRERVGAGFDRFLYEVVVPEMYVRGSRPT